MTSKQKCLVTGGSGFLGRRLVQDLSETGRYDVTVFDVRMPQEGGLPPDVRFFKGNLRNDFDCLDGIKGMDVVFHVATAAPSAANSLSEELMRSVNVDGTKNVIDACVRHGVRKLIYTSSASVAFDGSDILNKDEAQLGYAATPVDHYTATKMMAEKLVLEANGRGGILATCALRPSAIFGEGDALMLPTLVKRAKQGKMKYIIGDGENLMDFTYVGNVTQAHLLAAEKLELHGDIAGQAYFITNQYLIAPLLRLFMQLSSDLTVSRIRIVTRNRAFNSKKSIQHLGYIPKVSMDEAKQRTIEAFNHLKNKRN